MSEGVKSLIKSKVPIKLYKLTIIYKTTVNIELKLKKTYINFESTMKVMVSWGCWSDQLQRSVWSKLCTGYLQLLCLPYLYKVFLLSDLSKNPLYYISQKSTSTQNPWSWFGPNSKCLSQISWRSAPSHTQASCCIIFALESRLWFIALQRWMDLCLSP